MILVKLRRLRDLLRSSRRLLILCLLILSLVLASGCTTHSPKVAENNSPQVAEKPMRFLSPMKISYLVVNPLEVGEERDHQGTSQDSTFLVYGLKDQVVQEKINSRLKRCYQEVKDADLPPYRGIRVKIPDASKVVHNSLYAYASFNYNNILSVVVTNSRGYSFPGQDYPIHINTTETLNFNLNTGDEITLEDIFTDDVDYLAILNENVGAVALRSQPGEEYYGYGDAGLRLIQPFEGLRRDQKFHLFQGGIALVFDYRTPEFETYFYPTTHSIFFSELDDVVALTERFRTEESLYISEAPLVKELLQSRFNGYPPPAQERVLGKVSVSTTVSYPLDLPDHIKNLIQNLSEDYMPTVDELNQRSTSSDYWYLHQYVNTRQVGPYLNIDRRRSLSGSNNQGEVYNASYCFDEDYTQVSLSDLFAPGFNYGIAIRDALSEALFQYGLNNHYSAEDLYNGLHFGLGTSEVFFFTKSIKFSDQQNGNIQSVHFQVPFAVFGCHNMTIFK